MKHVVKGGAPAEFDAWLSMANAEWSPTYPSLQNPEKRALHAALLKEQGDVCCYCGRSISLDDSHIEHFRPQESLPDLALDYGNLFASCIRESKPGNPLHCGHAKGNDFDEALHISPRDESCQRRFVYGLDGGISPADPDDEAAHYMNELLKLDLDFLRNRRRDVLERVFDPDFLTTATDDDLRKLAAVFGAADQDGKLDSFSHVLCRFIEQLSASAI